MSQSVNTDYHFALDDDLTLLPGATIGPIDFRREILQRYLDRNGSAALLEAFAQFMGLTNSLVENNRESIERFLKMEHGYSPQKASRVNLPTVLGAFRGIEASIEPVRGMCKGCAFRSGTAANQCLTTVVDAVDRYDVFMCHEGLDANMEPTRRCAGFKAANKTA